jgi:hypothetical protein
MPVEVRSTDQLGSTLGPGARTRGGTTLGPHILGVAQWFSSCSRRRRPVERTGCNLARMPEQKDLLGADGQRARLAAVPSRPMAAQRRLRNTGFTRCCLTFELRGARRYGAWPARPMINSTASRAKCHAGARPFQRRVRRLFWGWWLTRQRHGLSQKPESARDLAGLSEPSKTLDCLVLNRRRHKLKTSGVQMSRDPKREPHWYSVFPHANQER